MKTFFLDPLTAWFVHYNAARDLRLYARTGERFVVLRAFRSYRTAGMPVPENVLLIIDTWAEEQPTRRASAAIRKAERNLDVMDQLHVRQHELEPPQAANRAARAVAADMGLTFGNVRVIKSRWSGQTDTEDGPLT